LLLVLVASCPQIVCSLFLNPGDCVVAEEYTYPQMLECQLIPHGCPVLPAPMDHEGLLPERLEEVG